MALAPRPTSAQWTRIPNGGIHKPNGDVAAPKQDEFSFKTYTMAVQAGFLGLKDAVEGLGHNIGASTNAMQEAVLNLSDAVEHIGDLSVQFKAEDPYPNLPDLDKVIPAYDPDEHLKSVLAEQTEILRETLIQEMALRHERAAQEMELQQELFLAQIRKELGSSFKQVSTANRPEVHHQPVQDESTLDRRSRLQDRLTVAEPPVRSMPYSRLSAAPSITPRTMERLGVTCQRKLLFEGPAIPGSLQGADSVKEAALSRSLLALASLPPVTDAVQEERAFSSKEQCHSDRDLVASPFHSELDSRHVPGTGSPPFDRNLASVDGTPSHLGSPSRGIGESDVNVQFADSLSPTVLEPVPEPQVASVILQKTERTTRKSEVPENRSFCTVRQCRRFFIKDNWIKRPRENHAVTTDACGDSCEYSSALPGSSPSQALGDEIEEEAGEDMIWKESEYNGCLSCVIAQPSSRFRLAWEMLGALLIVNDLITLPLLVFKIPDSTAMDTMHWIALLYWTLNIGQTCTLGYVHAGAVVMAPARIWKHYLRTWFPIDALVLIPDWFSTISALWDGESTDAQQGVKVLQVLKLFRLARLLRLVRLKRAWNMLFDLIDSEKVGIVANVIKLIGLLLILNHFVACGWFFIADEQSGMSWVKFHGYTLLDATWDYQYLTAYHWSITQFTPSSMDVQPHSKGERVFAIIVIVFALVVFSYLVGSITASLGQLRGMAEQETTQFWNLRRYLKRNEVTPRLKVRIISYCESKWQHQQKQVQAATVQLLKLLSSQLNQELHNAIHGPTLRVHPLFERIQRHCPMTCCRLAMHATSTTSLARRDYFCITGEVASHLSIVVAGRLKYVPGGTMPPETVDHRKDWISEPVLWLDSWKHLGDLCALCDTHLLMIDSAQFHAVVCRNPGALRLVSVYAAQYVEWMNGEEFPMSDVSQGEQVRSKLITFLPTIPMAKAPSMRGSLSWLSSQT